MTAIPPSQLEIITNPTKSRQNPLLSDWWFSFSMELQKVFDFSTSIDVSRLQTPFSLSGVSLKNSAKGEK